MNLSHDIQAADLTFLRSAGYAFQFQIRPTPTVAEFQQIDSMSNRTLNQPTTIYGAAATDLNDDQYLDLATINETSADVRVFLNRADGSGLFHPFLTPQPIGEESSPNDPADFDNDGRTDLCVCASAFDVSSVYVMLGAGNGTFSSITQHPVGSWPHGIATLDVDGDADADIVNANAAGNTLSLLINNGAGIFGAPTFFDSFVEGEYGLEAADMNNDGITDLVVAGNTNSELRVLLGNGNATFMPAGPPTPSGGHSWVVVVDDVNGDGNLDAAVANGFSTNGAIVLGNGAGGLGAPTIITTGSHTPSVDLGDLDGDGDPDLVLSCYVGGFWRVYRNDAGTFVFDTEIDAVSNPSCAVLLDFDNDGDVDMALTDEVADVVLLMRNTGAVHAPAPRPAPLRLFASPNPFRDRTWLRCELPMPSPASIEVFDVSGRRVASFVSGPLSAGAHRIPFDGRGTEGSPLPAGAYVVRLTAGDHVESAKMILTR